jgi:hypothetical protein
MTNWFIQVMGEEQGPLTAAQLKALARRGSLAPDSLVRREDRFDWVLAEQLQGLFADVGATPIREAVPPGGPLRPEAGHAVDFPPSPVISSGGGNGRAVSNDRRSKNVGKSKKAVWKSIWNRIVYVIDPMFERFLTPWIIRVTWGLVLLAAVAMVALYAYVNVSVLAALQPDMRNVEVAQARVDMVRELIERQESRLESPQSSRRADRRQPDREIPERPSSGNKPEPELTLKQVLELAEADLEKAKAELPSRWSLAFKAFPLQSSIYTIEVLACILAVLWCRVLLEAAIVLFQMVTKLRSIDERLATMQPPPP